MNENERFFVKVGNCYVAFIGIWHDPIMRSDYHKATPFLTKDEAKEEVKRKLGRVSYKIVKKNL